MDSLSLLPDFCGFFDTSTTSDYFDYVVRFRVLLEGSFVFAVQYPRG